MFLIFDYSKVWAASIFISNLLQVIFLQPHIDFGLKLLGADLMSIPGLYRFVQVFYSSFQSLLLSHFRFFYLSMYHLWHVQISVHLLLLSLKSKLQFEIKLNQSWTTHLFMTYLIVVDLFT